MNRRTLLNVFGLLIAASALSMATHSARAADPSMTGAWELNIAKSSSTVPLPKSQTRTYEATAQQEKMTATGVDAKGSPVSIQFNASFDGKDYPYQGPNADMIAITPVNALTNTMSSRTLEKSF
ncbi:MAG: hypothetical protein ABL901_18965 [Hyphomicrobiaceae bacterium]